jgi:uncharacterized protein YjbJ (UPF0337 family)
MKNAQINSHFKEMKGKVKEAAGKFISIREPGYEVKMLNALGKIEAAYADLKNDYKKAG